MKRIAFNHLFLLLFAVAPVIIFAQKPPVKPGKISEEELALKFCPLDSNARAMIICDFGKSYFDYDNNSGFRLYFDRYLRVKIFNNNGYDWADHTIKLYKSGPEKEKIAQLKATTYNLDNGKIEKEKLRNKEVFTDEISKNYDYVKFSMPQVREGSVIEIEYTVVSDFFFNLTPWYFQYDIPALWSEYYTNIPEFLKYKRTLKGYIPLHVNESTSQRKTVMVSSKERSGRLVQQTTFETNTYDYVEFREHWAVKDVPPFIEEEPLTSRENYISKMEFELSSYEPLYGLSENYTKSWADINKLLLDHANFGDQLRGGGYLKDLVEEINGAASDPHQITIMAYQAIQSHMKWNGHNELFADQSLRSAFKDRNGNSAEINLMLVLLLRELGINSDPVAISTRKNGLITITQPTVSGFNSLLAMAKVDEQVFLMDATDPIVPFGLLPEKDLNERGRIISENQSDWINLVSNNYYKAFSMFILTLDTDEKLSGNYSSAYTDYAAINYRKKILAHTSEEEYIQSLQENNKGLMITSYELINRNEIASPYKEKFEVTIADQTINTGDIIYFNPMMYDAVTENPYKLEKRTYPVEYAYPQDISYMLTFNIPEGYTVDEFPQNTVVKLPDNAGSFSYTASVMGNSLQVMSKIQINKLIFGAEEYEYLKAFFDHIIAKHSEQVVLSKL